MATHGKDDAVEGSWSAKRPRTAAEQRAEVVQQPPPKQALSTDPETLANDIERTRTELAETLDAIADKVSPKRVARRTGKKVGDSVKETAVRAEAAVKTGAQAAVESVKDAAEAVRDKVGGDRGDGAVELPVEPRVAMSSASDTVAPTPVAGSQETVVLPARSAGALADATPEPVVAPAGGELPPVRPVRPVPAYVPAPASMVPLYVGAAAAVAVLLLVLRRRRR